MMSGRISIGVPVYNGERYLALCLDSLLAQSEEDFELLIADNASTDASWEICQEYAARDKRIRILRNERNLGAARNYNLLVGQARGSLFKWMPHDDLLAPEYLRRCSDALEGERGAVVAYPTTVMIDAEGNRLDNDPIDHLEVDAESPHERLRQYFTWSWKHPGCNAVLGLIRTAVLRKTALVGAYPSSDKVLLAELALHGRFLHLPDPLFFRREHAGSSLKTHPDMAARAAWFDTDVRQGQKAMELRWFWEYVRAITRSVRPGPELWRSVMAMRRYYELHGHKLRREIKHRLGRR
jgi:glycosyltransferase involved in cell wall biosynthesis